MAKKLTLERPPHGHISSAGFSIPTLNRQLCENRNFPQALTSCTSATTPITCRQPPAAVSMWPYRHGRGWARIVSNTATHERSKSLQRLNRSQELWPPETAFVTGGKFWRCTGGLEGLQKPVQHMTRCDTLT